MSLEAFRDLQSAIRVGALEIAVDEVARILEKEPGATGDQVLDALRARATMARVIDGGRSEVLTEDGCVRCGRALLIMGSGFVTHISADGGTNRGCRAATFTPDEGWDEAIPRSWYAKLAR